MTSYLTKDKNTQCRCPHFTYDELKNIVSNDYKFSHVKDNGGHKKERSLAILAQLIKQDTYKIVVKVDGKMKLLYTQGIISKLAYCDTDFANAHETHLANRSN